MTFSLWLVGWFGVVILEGTESKRFYYVIKDSLQIIWTAFSFDFKCILIFSRRWISRTTPKKILQSIKIRLYLFMNDLLFKKQKCIKDELFWSCCVLLLLLLFLINICYTNIDFSLKCLFLLQWTMNQGIFSSLKICMLCFSYIHVHIFFCKKYNKLETLSIFFLYLK